MFILYSKAKKIFDFNIEVYKSTIVSIPNKYDSIYSRFSSNDYNDKRKNLYFEINKDDSTATLVYIPISKSIFIPSSVNFNNEEFIITQMKNKLFSDFRTKLIEFAKDSKISLIKENMFLNSSIETIIFPDNLKCLKEGWCHGTSKLIDVKISEKNKNYKYLDVNHQVIIGKSNPETEEYDTIIFASRNIKEIIIPSYIKYIESYSFEECKFLKKIEFEEESKLESIGPFSFSGSSLSSILIPSKVHRINEFAFNNCNKFQILDFRNSSTLKELNNELFYSSSIASLIIPESVKCLKEGWCHGTSKLIDVKISEKNKNYKYLDENKQVIIGKSNPETEEYDTIIFASRNIKEIIIPSYIKYIESYSFEECKLLENIQFEEESKLESIGKYSLSKTSIASIIIPKYVKYIGQKAFYINKNLQNVSFSKDSELENIENEAFTKTKIEYIEFPSNLARLGEKVLLNYQTLKIVSFKNGPKNLSLEKDMFIYSMIETLIFPDNLKCLKEGWCHGTSKLIDVKISEKNKNFKYLDENKQVIIGKSNPETEEYDTIIFASRNIKEIIIPSYIKYIESYSFEECKLLENIQFELESKLDTFGQYSFHNSSIGKIIIPSNVRYINEGSFYRCQNLRIINFSDFSKLQLIGSYAFGRTSPDFISVPPKVEKIEKNAFINCYNLKTVDFSLCSKSISIDFTYLFKHSSIQYICIPSNVKKICEHAFAGCKKLKKVDFCDRSEAISFEIKSFLDCSVESLVFPDNLRYLKEGWCHGTSKLIDVKISEKNKNFKYLDENKQVIIGKSNPETEEYDTIIFASRNIKEIIIPSYIKYIESYSFEECKLLEKIEFERNSNLRLIGKYSFADSTLKLIDIPLRVLKIGKYSFNKCKKLKYVNFEKNSELIKISSHAFYSSSIRTLVFPSNFKGLLKESYINCSCLQSIEYNGDCLKFLKVIFEGNNTQIYAFPNAQLIYLPTDFSPYSGNNCVIYVCHSARIINDE